MCRTLHLSWPARFHLAPALLPILRHDLPQLSRLFILARSIPAPIHNKRVSAIWVDVQPTTSYEPKGSCRKRWSMCHAIILPQTEYNIDLRFCCEHGDTPPESDLDDEQIRALLASPLYFQEREVSADRSRVLSLCKRKLGVKFVSSSEEYGRNPLRCFQAEGNRVKKHFPTKKNVPQNINKLKETTNLYSDSLIRKIR